MSKQVFDQKAYCSAMCYYLNHIKLDLSFKRQDSLRSYVDHIVAMISGYTTTGRTYKGDWGKFKISCYASKGALAMLQTNEWSTRGIGVTMEHVVPINVIGNVLLNQQEQNIKPLTCDEILQVLQDLVIPCLITKIEDGWLSKNNLKNSMPYGWTYFTTINNQWERYQKTTNPTNPPRTLFDDIVAINPPTWMHKPGFPPTISPAVKLPSRLLPTTPTSSCNCLNLLNTGLSSNCMDTN